jgi:membrane fusion protein (multidrug efflux system)
MKKTAYRSILYFILISLGLPNVYAQPATPVIVAPVKSTSISGDIEALGTLQSVNNVNLSALVTEYITDINFTDGQRVKKGDILIKMDIADEQAILAEEQARYTEAKQQVDRLATLTKTNASSESALDTQKSIMAISKARMAGIQTAIEKRIIKAPFDGIMGLRQISVGNLAQPGMQLATLDQDSQMKLDFTVSADLLSQLQPGLTIEATTTAFPGKIFTGTLSSLNSRVNPTTRMIGGRVIIDNQNHELKSGLLMRLIIAAEEKPALLIPEEALTSEGGQHYVYVIDNSQDGTVVRKTAIKIGARPDGQIAVTEGLKTDQQVVIHGTLRIHDGSPVSITAVKKDNQPLTQLLQQNTES